MSHELQRSSASSFKGFKDKLYGYLDGYEIVGFTGLPCGVVQNSFYELFMDDIRALGYAPDMIGSLQSIRKLVNRFLVTFYDRMGKMKKREKVPDLAEEAKTDSNTLSNLVSILTSGDTCHMDSCYLAAVSPKGNVNLDHARELSFSCPFYLNRRFCLIYGKEDEEDLTAEDFRLILPESRFLALAMVKLFHSLVKQFSYSEVTKLQILFQDILFVSKVFELMNPTGTSRTQYLKDAEARLTSTPLDKDSPDYQHWREVFKSVCDDITEGRLPYIQDIHQALVRNRRYLDSKYDPVHDEYVSMHGTAQSTWTHKRYSLVSSALELDNLKRLFADFDAEVGFESHYATVMENDSGITITNMRVSLINNPGKFKPRIIHLADNPIQDRCNYLHRRLQALLKSMRTDCTQDHDRGRQFLRLKTLQWFTSGSSQKRGIYCYDFSNATDTLDQEFQKMVLEFVFGPGPIPQFWDTLASLAKYIDYEDGGGWHAFTQLRGQPQGLLGSFEAFALAHHFIFLMEMKELGFEGTLAEDYYRILGDDSVSVSPRPEGEWFDPDAPDYDVAGLPRSVIETTHFKICQQFADFEINFSKSESTHWNSLEAKLDFAKVTFRNGEFFSPVPFRLAMAYSKSESSKLAVAIWRGQRGDSLAVPFMNIVLQDIANPELDSIIKCGVLPYLDRFKDLRVYNPSWLARLRYATAMSYCTSGLGFLGLRDQERSWTGDIDSKVFSQVFGKNYLKDLDMVDPNHKVFRIISDNYDVIRLMADIDTQVDPDEKFWALAISPLGSDLIQEEFFEVLYGLVETSKLLRMAKDHPTVDVSQVFPDFDMRYRKNLEALSTALTTRGIHRKPREEVVLLESTLWYLEQVADILGSIPESVMTPSKIASSL